MSKRDLAALEARIGDAKVISTDVFDTLLLRDATSERARIVEAERLFALRLAAEGFHISPDILVDLRLRTQKLAFRALDVGSGPGEVQLRDIVARQTALLGLPERFVATRLDLEMAVERRHLSANVALAATLRACRARKIRIIAISDTTVPGDALEDLIAHFHGRDLIDAVFASADLGKTKRRGDIFAQVLTQEGIAVGDLVHLGDDPHADLAVPSRLGIAACHLPRQPLRHTLRRAHGGLTEVKRRLKPPVAPTHGGSAPPSDARGFGRDILGPIVAQFSVLIWLYADQARATDKAALCFCARGGIGIREAFERTLERLGISFNLPRDNLMISRVVAARSAALVRSPTALEELAREFGTGSHTDVARALGGRAYDLAPEWARTFDPDAFYGLLFGPSGAEVLADVTHQNALFARHFRSIIGNADRVILCDTGLYGSTQRLLAAGYPDLAIETVQLARSNYKGHSESHFPQVTGLLVERNGYSPLRIETIVLRYWQLIESLFEPAVPSVRMFHEVGHDVAGNCGDITFGAVDPAAGNDLLSGVLDYIDALPAGAVADMLADAGRAWPRLRRAITYPSPDDIACISVGERSVDFGRPELVSVLGASGAASFAERLKSLRKQLWREGAIVRDFPRLKTPMLVALECVYALRSVSLDLHR